MTHLTRSPLRLVSATEEAHATEIAVVEGLDYLTRVSVDDVVADLMSKLVIACTDPLCHFAVSCFKGIIPVLDDLSSGLLVMRIDHVERDAFSFAFSIGGLCPVTDAGRTALPFVALQKRPFVLVAGEKTTNPRSDRS